MKNFTKLLLLFFSLFIFSESFASHLLGSEITYTCVGPNQYRVRLTVYRDCAGVSAPSSASLNYSSQQCNVSTNITLQVVQSPVDITPLCPTQASRCGSNGPYGIQEVILEGVINLPPGCGSDWVLSWNLCCRNDAINNLGGPGNQNMGVTAQLDNTIQPLCNNSPVFNNVPAAILCINQPFVYNHGVVDPDGDSLYFSLGNCIQNPNSNVNYTGGWSPTNPLPTVSGVTINPNTGAISFTPNQTFVGVICIKVEEYRNGVKIGEVNRDMQFRVINCSNVPPEASGINGAPNTDPQNFQLSLCANNNFCFDILFNDPNSNNITVSWNQEIPAATFTVVDNGTISPVATFCWSPPSSSIGQNVFSVNVIDDACPVVGSGTYTYVVNVTPSPNTLNAGADQTICQGESATLTATSVPVATSFTWTPVATLNTPNGASVVATPLVTTSYEVTANFPDGCDLTDVVVVNVAPDPVISITPLNPFNCANQNNTITATASNAASYSWAPGGFTTPTINVAPAATTTYTVTVTSPFGCVSQASNTITIAQPAGNVCNVLYVTPTGLPTNDGTRSSPMDLQTAMTVGACNGTIIKMAIGDYVTDTTINRVTSYLTLEGGYDNNVNWEKISTAGATRILKTATMTTSTANGSGIIDENGLDPRTVAMNVTGQTGFRFQDITIQTQGLAGGSPILGYRGVSTYALQLNTCNAYNVVRTQLVAEAASNGSDQGGGSPATNGGSSYGLHLINNGAGGNLVSSNVVAGAFGLGGVPGGANGVSQAIRTTGGGSALAINQGTFNLAAQPTIRMDDIACTNTPIGFRTAASNSWAFGLGSSPGTATGATVSSMYSNLGRKDITYSANNYIGFNNIILDDQVIPEFTTSAPFIQGQYRVCAGDSVSFQVTNGGVGYTYIWTSGSLTYQGVGQQYESFIVAFDTPGIYPIQLNFETSCCGISIPAFLDLYVEEQPEAIMPADDDICFGSGVGAELTIGGAVPGGSITWIPTSGLSSGNSYTVTAEPSSTTTYQVTLSDSTGLCVSSEDITISVIDINVVTSITDATCGPDGTAQATVTGGSGDYTYDWRPIGLNGQSITGLQVGTYTVLVTDNTNGCQDSAFAVVNPGPGTLVGFISNSENVSCFGLSDGEISVSVVGGVAPFTYDWGINGSTTTSSTSNTILDLTEGEYDVLITDNVGCTYEVTGFITEPLQVDFAVDTLYDPSCEGTNDGYIRVTTDGGVAPFTYSWNTSPPVLDNFVGGLGSGTYTLTATDFNGCIDSFDVTIQAQPVPIVSIDTIVCFGTTISISGLAPITPLNDTIVNDTIIVNGCFEAYQVTVTVLPLPSASISGAVSICDGENTDIIITGTPNAIVTYTINGGVNQSVTLDGLGNAIFNISGTTTTYTLVGIELAGTPSCLQTLTESATITVLPLPTASISGTTTVCDGENADITITGTNNALVTYTVNGGASQTVTLDATGNATLNTGSISSNATYTLVSVELSGTPNCSQALTESVTVTVLPLPTATISGTTSICDGENADITITGTPNAIVTYTINGGVNQSVTLDGLGNAIFNISGTTTTYTLVGIELAGTPSCLQTLTESATITVIPLPTASISGTTTVCDGENADITITGTNNALVTYTVNGGASQTVTLDAIGNATLNTGSISSNATYTLVSVELSGTPNCSQALTESVTVTVLSLPTATVSGTTSICDGENADITFTGTPNASITYNLNGGASQTIILNGAGTATVNTGAISTNTIYNLVSVASSTTPSCLQTITESATVTVIELPTASISASSVCEGQSTDVTFTGTPNATVTYTVNAGANQTVALDALGNATVSTGNLNAPATYQLVSVATAGTPICTQTLTQSVTVNTLPLPTASISGDNTLCQGSTATITFTGTPNTVITYTVNGGANQTINLDGTGNAQLSTGSLAQTTIYSLVSVDNNGCINSATGTATITINPSYNQTVGVSICSNETYTLPNGQVISTQGTYPVTLQTAAGCDSVITTNLTVNQLGVSNPLEDISVCEGFSETVTVDAQNMVTYEWVYNTGSGDITTVNATGFEGGETNTLTFNLLPELDSAIFTVRMTDECGNLFTESFTLRVYEPSAVENPLDDIEACLHELPQTITVDYNGYNYEWNDGTNGASVQITEAGDYIVNFLANVTNCRTSDTIVVTTEDCIANCVVLAPTGFTPDDSGKNDIFRVVTNCDEGFQFFEFRVYNRWGELVYMTNNHRQGWDGNYKGRTAEIGVYTYYVEYVKNLTNKNEILKGNVTLIR